MSKHSRTRRTVLRMAFALAAGATRVAWAAVASAAHGRGREIRTTPDAAAIAAIPAGFRFAEKGVLSVGLSPAWLPLSAYTADTKTLEGFDPDLAQLVADGLGLKLKLVPLAWEDWPLALASGKVDAVLSNVTVTEERKKKFDFSTYRRDVLGFYVPVKSAIRAIREPKDVAGLRVATDSGTNQEKILLAWSRQDAAHGLKPVNVQYYDDDAVRAVALQSGRTDAVLSVNSTLAWEAARKGQLRQVGMISGGWPRTAEVAVATRRGSGLAAPVTRLLNDLIQNGKYRQVLERWNLGTEAITRAETNPPGLPQT